MALTVVAPSRSTHGCVAVYVPPAVADLVASYCMHFAPHARASVVAEFKRYICPEDVKGLSVRMSCRCTDGKGLAMAISVGQPSPAPCSVWCERHPSLERPATRVYRYEHEHRIATHVDRYEEHKLMHARKLTKSLYWTTMVQSIAQWSLGQDVAQKNRVALNAAWREARGPPPSGA